MRNRDREAEATTFLSPIMDELTRSLAPGPRGVPRVGLAVRTRLLDAPASVVPWLVRFLEAAPARGIARRENVAHAVQVLGALGARSALTALFDVAVKLAEDPEANPERGSPVFGALGQAFEEFGEAIVAPLVPYLARNPGNVGRLLVLAGNAGVADDRLLMLFVEALDGFPCDAASALLLLGDTRAITPLRLRLAALPGKGIDDGWCRAILSVTHAIEVLGGELDARDERRVETALETHRALYAARAAAANARDRAITRCGESQRGSERR
ncbi:MAG: hypothetical protein F9K40_12030 [Kofleriaceae bacterium]|nr:MAG: hypothetical protein F9K40_12030 [Kofleriaceae bacterium]